MREWLVGGAVIEGPDGLLLVENVRRDGARDWTPPGGVIDPGEDVVEGLAREVVEETGLVVTSWAGPVYRITAEAPDLGWLLGVEVWRATSWEGELTVGRDPDGIVVDARFVDPEACAACLDGGHRWVVEPVHEWLTQRWDGDRHFGYRIEGDRRDALVVSRC